MKYIRMRTCNKYWYLINTIGIPSATLDLWLVIKVYKRLNFGSLYLEKVVSVMDIHAFDIEYIP